MQQAYTEQSQIKKNYHWNLNVFWVTIKTIHYIVQVNLGCNLRSQKTSHSSKESDPRIHQTKTNSSFNNTEAVLPMPHRAITDTIWTKADHLSKLYVCSAQRRHGIRDRGRWRGRMEPGRVSRSEELSSWRHLECPSGGSWQTGKGK